MLKIWGRKNSNNVRKVLWCAEELGLPYERIDAGGAFGVVNDPAFRAKNPNGLVPLIEDGDFLLWESNAIVRYLCARHGEGSLLPDSLTQRASADRWMDWMSTSFVDPFRTVFWGLVRTSEAERDLPAIQAAVARCNELLAIPARALETQPFLSGERLGMGDIPLGSFIYGWFEMPIERQPRPALEAWYERLKQRRAYRDGVMTELT
ncbi:glutathione S-transferase family protein [Pseudomonas indica]|uniref:glutathione S-transferase family protein n=1 Tax=Pseudomonas indica TaxID=137658 RepID=UPI000BAB563C|nr:glutathione S-transferase [Pseudomonas indica]PAU51829.1 glutathione S-transferase [Pseudomonas indica]